MMAGMVKDKDVRVARALLLLTGRPFFIAKTLEDNHDNERQEIQYDTAHSLESR